MGGVVSGITDGIGLTNYGQQKSDLERQQQEAQNLAKTQAQKLAEQQKAVDAQKLAEQKALNAKKKLSAQAFSGGSGLLNFDPQSQSSILG